MPPPLPFVTSRETSTLSVDPRGCSETHCTSSVTKSDLSFAPSPVSPSRRLHSYPSVGDVSESLTSPLVDPRRHTHLPFPRLDLFRRFSSWFLNVNSSLHRR